MREGILGWGYKIKNQNQQKIAETSIFYLKKNSPSQFNNLLLKANA